MIKGVREWLNKDQFSENDVDCIKSVNLNITLRKLARNFPAEKSLILSTPDWKSYFTFILNHNMSDEIAESRLVQ